MPILPILTYNDPNLRKTSKPVSPNTPDLGYFIENLFETMYNSNGIGLAAPQVGKLWRVFVIDADPVTEDEGELYGPMVFINPEIISKSEEIAEMDEGCLSIPELNDRVKRPAQITVNYFDISFQPKTLEADGWLSRVIQHEFDHLEGILFIDHLSAFRRRIHRKHLQDIDKGILEIKYPVVPKP